MWKLSGRLWKGKLLRGVSSPAQPVRSTGSGSGDPRGTWRKPSGFDSGLKVYNSLTRKKEPLILAREGVATWYSCGPTVYDHAHLGHACSYVRFDILQRILSKVFGVTVVHAMAITDIDEKIIRRSWEENVCPSVIARTFEDDFKRDMLALNVIPPSVHLRVTDNVPLIISFIEGIIQNGHAYATKQGDVYFDIQSIGDRYGKFRDTGHSWEEPVHADKRDPRDFVLWRKSKPQEPSWGSPWGRGRPGWHIECSTLASSIFGSQLDIHSGGIDLAFPHHENEIAQSEAHHRCSQWANYFLHSGHLHLKGSPEKMSKSLKNYVTIKDFMKSYSASEFRMFCLFASYKSAIDYSDASMGEARAALASVSTFAHAAQAYMKGHLQCSAVQEAFLWGRLAETKSSVMKALADDFDTRLALGALMELVYHGNCQLQPVSRSDGAPRSPAVFAAMLSYIRDVLDVFGIDLLHSKEAGATGYHGNLEGVVERLTRFRSEVRAFALTRPDDTNKLHPDRIPLLQACDALRNNLAPLGVLIKDRGVNSTWEIIKSQKDQRSQEEDEKL
ncbi:probable cysteine--tRNA ligase, mitochondrial [Antennarius striatus]|uniref:probable cysteine--tRNA ligase, mitochondrial n=1 Tax=Antennarius striatus TaxID=241820 RepID=UPI0035B4B0DE